MNVVQCLSHSIEQYDMLKLYASLGIDAFDVGGYIDPDHPHEDKRPPLPQVTFHPDLKAAVDSIGAHDNLGAAQERLPEALLDWADVIVYHHYLDRLYGQWDRIRRWLAEGSHRRVIWRTVGQSVDHNERQAQQYRAEGLEIVRYSPKEENIPGYAGADALIRFYKDPSEWYGWTGHDAVVINITQDLFYRGEWTNYPFWRDATAGLPALAMGPGSQTIGGTGTLSYDEMRQRLRDSRVYLYTGTQPASYTLGLIEAMMTGIPIVSIGHEHMTIFPFGPRMFEGHELANYSYNNPRGAHDKLAEILGDLPFAEWCSEEIRAHAIDLFGMEKIAAQWAAYLGVGVLV